MNPYLALGTSLLVSALRDAIERVVKILEELEEVRDRVIKESRDVLKLARETIMCVHKGTLDEAYKICVELQRRVKSILAVLRNYPHLYYGGLMTGALVEYAEALILLSIVREGRVPPPEELGIEHVPYLLALGDVVGELRRLVIDSLRRGDLRLGEHYFRYMEDIYENLSLIVVPDALVPGLRGKVDFARKILEITRADLLIARLKIASLEKIEEQSLDA